jgi:hypothetical protein
MSESLVSIGQSRVVGFFAVCCLLALMNAARGLLEGTSNGFFFSVAQCVFILLTGSAAWNLYQSRKIGWYLSLIVILNWFGAVTNLRAVWNAFTSIFTVGMIAVLIWLFRKDVRTRFEIRFETK